MSKCFYCERSIEHPNDDHSDDCPQIQANQKTAHAEYNRGWDLGRSGKSCPAYVSPTFLLGYGNGVCALESAQNGYDSKFN